MKAKYIVQINMADRGQKTQWTDCEDAKFVAREDALARIEWMKGEYGDQLNTVYAPHSTSDDHD